MTGKWDIEETFVVKTRNNLPTVFVLRQRDDVVKQRIFKGLNELTPFCSLSSDIFWSIRNKEGVNVSGLHSKASSKAAPASRKDEAS